MSTIESAPPQAQAARVRRWRIPRHPISSLRLSPDQIAQKQRRIRIERAVMAIARTRCDTRTACRSVGLEGYAAVIEVRRICDQRKIPRRRWWGTPLSICKTAEPHPALVKPN